MSECKRFRDMILTDYLDGEIGTEARERLEAHLKGCPDCRVFAREAKEMLEVPFKKVQPEEVPGCVWRNIRERLEADQEPRDIIGDLLERIFRPLLRPQLVPAYIVLFVFFFSGAFLVHNRMKLVKETEQGRYLMSTLGMGNGNGSTGMESEGLGTAIEDYFL